MGAIPRGQATRPCRLFRLLSDQAQTLGRAAAHLSLTQQTPALLLDIAFNLYRLRVRPLFACPSPVVRWRPLSSRPSARAPRVSRRRRASKLWRRGKGRDARGTSDEYFQNLLCSLVGRTAAPAAASLDAGREHSLGRWAHQCTKVEGRGSILPRTEYGRSLAGTATSRQYAPSAAAR
jgi:hypothetical protein